MPAKTFEDVILGEAKGGDFEDMVAVASTIVNRANALGVTPEQVIAAGNGSEFNAYGKKLPPGVDAYRSDAQKAIAKVLAGDVSHNGTFYATPAAQHNLPKGLKQVTSTSGHNYFTDPQNRAIRTTEGFRTPAKLAYALEGKGRSQIPSSGIADKVAAAAAAVDPSLTTVLFSGQEPKGRSPVGTQIRHPQGFAGDFNFKDASGNPITDQVRLKDIAMKMAADHNANIGYSNRGDYMGPSGMHIDTMPLDKYPGGAQWGSAAKSWGPTLDYARKTGVGPTPYLNAPTPTPRPSTAVGPGRGMSTGGPIVQPEYSAGPGRGMSPGGAMIAPAVRPAPLPAQSPMIAGTSSAPTLVGGASSNPPITTAGPGRGNNPGGPIIQPSRSGSQPIPPPTIQAGGPPNMFGAPMRQAGPSLGPAPATLNDPMAARSSPAAIDYTIRRDGWNTAGGPMQAMSNMVNKMSAPNTSGLFSLFRGMFG